MQNTAKKNPVIVFTCGPVKAAVWEDVRIIGDTLVKVHSVKIDRSYKDGEEWKHTNAFNAEDLPKVAVVANEAYKYVRMRAFTPGISPNANNGDSQAEQNDSFAEN